MSDDAPEGGEPGFAQVLSAIQELILYVDQRFTRVDAAISALRDEVEENAVLANTALAETRRDLAQVREDVLGVKVDVAQAESRQAKATARQVARHNQDRDAHQGHAGAA